MGHGTCCEHCKTVGTIDERLDAMQLTLAKMETDFGHVRKLVFGAVGLILTIAIGGGVAKALGL